MCVDPSRFRRLGGGLIFTVDQPGDRSGITPSPLGVHPLFIGDRARAFVIASRAACDGEICPLNFTIA